MILARASPFNELTTTLLIVFSLLSVVAVVSTDLRPLGRRPRTDVTTAGWLSTTDDSN